MASVKRYGDPAAKCPDCGLWGGQALEEPEGDYVTHADYVAREAELVSRIKALRDSACAMAIGKVTLVALLADDDASSSGEVAT